MALPESFLDELVSRSDILDVVGSYVQLIKRSGSNMFALCPFHSEKTPSFSVSSDKQIYHCFGCGKGGGVINFIMEIENISFMDAVHVLAKRAGMQVPDNDSNEELRSKRARMLELNKEAARFFHKMLMSPLGALAREYIAQRRISKAMAIKFGLGMAPDSWSNLLDEMVKLGYTRQELLDSGLCKSSKKNSGGMYDAFRNRLIFPVIDVRGSVIGFSGRILGDGEPKYLNSPDTVVFNKSRNLFALNFAKKTKENAIILVEGNIDVVSLHQAGFDSTVASLGTALTADQARLISRYTNNVVIAYDSDQAGVSAANRAIKILEKTGLAVKVLRLGGEKDPDDFIKKRGADAFKILLDKSENHIDYQLSSIRTKFELDSDDGRLAYLAEATDMLSQLESPVEREVYGARVAQEAGVSAEAVAAEVKKAFKSRMARQKKQEERKQMRPSANLQPADKSIRYENIRSAIAEEGVIRLLTLDSALLNEVSEISPDDFSSEFLSKMFELIRSRILDKRDVSPAALSTELDSAEMSRLTAIIQKPERVSNGIAAMHDYIDIIKTEKLKKNAKDDLLAVTQKYREIKGMEDKEWKA